MTDETPQPEGEPSPAAPEETPTAETKPFTYDDAVARRPGDEDDVAPAAEAPDSGDARRTGCSSGCGPGGRSARATAERPAGIFVPKWVGLVAAAIVAALVFGGIGYAIGDSSSDSGSTQNASTAFPNNGTANGGQQLPNGGEFPGYGGQLPNGGQLPDGNGDQRQRQRQRRRHDREQRRLPRRRRGQTAPTPRASRSPTWPTNSPAAKAGLQEGDVITAIDGKRRHLGDGSALGGPGQGER